MTSWGSGGSVVVPGVLPFDTYGNLESYRRLAKANGDASSVPKSGPGGALPGPPKSGKMLLGCCEGTKPAPRRELNIPNVELGIGAARGDLETVLM